MSGTLYLVPVPIGNLEDITLRAMRILSTVTKVACEDTRRTGQLFQLLELERPQLISLHDHNESRRAPSILTALRAGEDVALVSDAGTPTISDPGYRLVKAVIDAELSVVPLPGPCAAITALSACGLPTNQFRFLGFAPPKASALKSLMQATADATETLIFYVGPHHLVRFLTAAKTQYGGTRVAVICRELTKKFEEFNRGTLESLCAAPGTVRGEIVVVIGGADPSAKFDGMNPEELAATLLKEGLTPTQVSKRLVKEAGVSRDEAYGIVLALKRAQQTEQ